MVTLIAPIAQLARANVIKIFGQTELNLMLKI